MLPFAQVLPWSLFGTSLASLVVSTSRSNLTGSPQRRTELQMLLLASNFPACSTLHNIYLVLRAEKQSSSPINRLIHFLAHPLLCEHLRFLLLATSSGRLSHRSALPRLFLLVCLCGHPRLCSLCHFVGSGRSRFRPQISFVHQTTEGIEEAAENISRGLCKRRNIPTIFLIDMSRRARTFLCLSFLLPTSHSMLAGI